MPGRRSKISARQRRYHDYIRRETLKTAAVYEKRLARSRRKELRRVLALCRDYDSTDAIPGVIEANISENSYLPAWYAGIYKDVGVPSARRTARDLEQAKAAARPTEYAGRPGGRQRFWDIPGQPSITRSGHHGRDGGSHRR